MQNLRNFAFQAANHLVTDYIYLAQTNQPTPESLNYAIFFLFKSIEHDELFLDEFHAWLKSRECPAPLIKIIIGFIRQSAPITYNHTPTTDLDSIISRMKGTL